MENPIVTAARFAKKAKEILRRQKQALQRARDVIRKQAEELEFLKVLLTHNLMLDNGVVREVKGTVVECPQPFDVKILLEMPTAKRSAQA